MNKEPEMNVEMELLGFKGKLKRITTAPANPPFLNEDFLLAVVEFEKPYPVAIIETWFHIPVRDYSKDELLATVKKSGEQQLAASIEKHEKDWAKREADEQHKKELDALAQSIEQKFI